MTTNAREGVRVASTRSVGTAALRVEDPRILSGTGRYVDDIAVPGMAHAAFLRSTLPHAVIAHLDVARARQLSGVIAVYTGEDIVSGTKPLSLDAPDSFGYEPVFGLSRDKVRFVGDPLAIVVAESRARAEDACELIEVDYEPLQAVATYEQALAVDAPLVFDSLGTNVVYESEGSWGDLEAAFSAADVVLHETFSQHRVAQSPMECRGGVAAFDAAGALTYYTGSQSPHSTRVSLAEALDLELDRVRVLNGDIGGAFGLKLFTHREDVAVCAAARWSGRPVKWIEDRYEHLLASGQAREEQMEVSLAVRRDGTLLGLRGELLLDEGAYPAIPFPGGTVVDEMIELLPGPYRLGAYAMRARVIASNKCTYSAYRAPWAMETWVRERLLDMVARALELDPAEIRRRNLLPGAPGDTMTTGRTLEGSTAAGTLERAVELAGYEQLRSSQLVARDEGRHLGIGIATCIQAAPGPRQAVPPRERARTILEPNGHLLVLTAQAPHGQGHETTLAQIASDELGVPIEHVRVLHGDTASAPVAMVGTGGSMAATMASGAVLHATRSLKHKVLAVAAELLEASPDDLVVADGSVHVAGVSSAAVSVAEVARLAAFHPRRLPPELDTILEASATYDGGLGGWSSATHLCVVELDLRTGKVAFLRYLVVQDCGRLINPAIVAGQIRGAVAQAIGEVLYERAAYDAEGNYLSATFMDYLLPSATDVPEIEIDHLETVPNDEVAYRGVGEGGMLVGPAAITNAVEDALAPFGARVTEQYLPPTRVLELAKVIN